MEDRYNRNNGNHSTNRNTTNNRDNANNRTSWMDHPAMKEMDPAKLELIRMAAARTADKSGRDLVPVMMALITGAGKKGIRFTPEETGLILEVLKEGKSREEQDQIDRMLRMTDSVFRRHSS